MSNENENQKFKPLVDKLQEQVDSLLEGTIFGCKVSYEKYWSAIRFKTTVIFQKDDVLSMEMIYQSYDQEYIIKHILLNTIGSMDKAMKNHLLGKDIK